MQAKRGDGLRGDHAAPRDDVRRPRSAAPPPPVRRPPQDGRPAGCGARQPCGRRSFVWLCDWHVETVTARDEGCRRTASWQTARLRIRERCVARHGCTSAIGPTLEVTGTPRQGAWPARCMINKGAARARRLASARPVDRGVRPQPPGQWTLCRQRR